jgi:SAM-dependent methyltransferase
VWTPSDFRSCDFDLVYSSGVFHHIPPGERTSSLALIYEALRPGGVVAIAEHNPWNPATRYLVRMCPFDEEVHLLRPAETTRLLEAAGFNVLSRHFVSFFPGFLRALSGIESSLTAVPLGAQYIVLARREA